MKNNPKEVTGRKINFQVRGSMEKIQKTKVQGLLMEIACRGKMAIILEMEILGLLLEIAIRGIMGIIRKTRNLAMIEVGRQGIKMGRGIMGRIMD